MLRGIWEGALRPLLYPRVFGCTGSDMARGILGSQLFSGGQIQGTTILYCHGGITTRIVGCAFLSAALVFVLDSYFGVLGALKPDAEPKVRTGLVFWGNNAVNVAFAVLLLAGDIVYRKWTQSRAWSGARYRITGHGA